MLKLTIIELFIAVIPEAFFFMFGAYTVAKQPFNISKIILSTIITGVGTYYIRLLPLFPGSNILLTFLLMAILLAACKIEILKVISALLLLTIIRLTTEWLNVLFVSKVLNLSLETLMEDPIRKTLYNFPFILLFGLIIFIIYRINCIRSNRINGSY